MLNPTDDLIERLLVAEGFNFALPCPKVAWRAFKFYAAINIPEFTTVTIGYSLYHAADRDDILWLYLGRRFEDFAGCGWSSGCLLSRTVPSELAEVHNENWWWSEYLSLNKWFAEVESNLIFHQCLALEGWTWKGFSD